MTLHLTHPPPSPDDPEPSDALVTLTRAIIDELCAIPGRLDRAQLALGAWATIAAAVSDSLETRQ